MKNKKSKRPEDIGDLRAIEIVKKADQLLDAVIVSSNILKKKPFTVQSLKEAKIVSSFTNTVVNAMGKKLQVYRTEIFLDNLPSRLSQIAKLKKKGHFK